MSPSPRVESARQIADWLKRSRRTTFTRRDAHQALRRVFHEVKELDVPLGLLVEHGYIRRAQAASGPKGGRPSELYEVNPAFLDATVKTARVREAGEEG
jgi:hypothetical protein